MSSFLDRRISGEFIGHNSEESISSLSSFWGQRQFVAVEAVQQQDLVKKQLLNY